ncbi:MAG: efflux RND transporter periplasmic adaptor subunit [Rhodobacteraceae bacterium]|nr:efflux RND transporter periplasmic adaptor subunit [Paracoccaceae bacterium]
MNLAKQITLGFIAVLVSVVLWAVYVPAAAPWLERAGVYALLGLDAPVAAEAGSGGFRGGGTARVVVSDVGTGQVNARVLAVGDGRAASAVTVRSEVSGMVVDLGVTSGSYVEQGALIAQLDDEAERIAMERAALVVENAQRDVDRVRQLSAAGTVSDVQLREVELAFRSAQLGQEQAALDLAQRTITAPISGWVGLLDVATGDRVGPQDSLAMITDRSSLVIEFRVPERYLTQLSVGQPLEVAAVARPDVILNGEILALDNVVDRASRTLRVRGQVANPDDRLREGQAFQVTLSFPGDNLPMVDPLAIQWSSDGAFVWAVREGAATRVPVIIRQRNSDSVLVEADLQPSDQVVIEGVQSLRPGATVEIVSAAPQSADAAPVGSL